MAPPSFICLPKDLSKEMDIPNSPDNGNDVPATQVAGGADGLVMKCVRIGRRRTDGGEVFCGGPECGRVIHPGCFDYHISRRKEWIQISCSRSDQIAIIHQLRYNSEVPLPMRNTL